jgi:hypothetical protein
MISSENFSLLHHIPWIAIVKSQFIKLWLDVIYVKSVSVLNFEIVSQADLELAV